VAPDTTWMRARCVGYPGFSGGQLPPRDRALVWPSLLDAARLISPDAIDVHVTEVFPLEHAADAHRMFEHRATVDQPVVFVVGLVGQRVRDLSRSMLVSSSTRPG
jgi:NADPH:quinone reductase-like Zn-dependent oxidoreductase